MAYRIKLIISDMEHSELMRNGELRILKTQIKGVESVRALKVQPYFEYVDLSGLVHRRRMLQWSEAFVTVNERRPNEYSPDKYMIAFHKTYANAQKRCNDYNFHVKPETPMFIVQAKRIVPVE